MWSFRRTLHRVPVIVWTLLVFLAGTSQAMNVEITNIDIDDYPGIHVYVRVTDDEGNYIQDLGAYNFEVRENGELLDIYLEPQFGYLAVTLVMDESGSMAGCEQDVIDACSYFVEGLDGLDKGAIVKFSTTSRVDVPMTYDHQALLNSIEEYVAAGWTDLFDAIALGIDECFYEPERKAVVTFTDGNNNMPGVAAMALPGMAGSDITIYTIGIGDFIVPDSLIYIAEETGGFYLPIEDPSQMQEVLIDIRSDIDNLYDVFYNTPNPDLNGTNRMLEVQVTYLGETAWDTASYTAPLVSPPEIILSPETTALLGVPQNPNWALHISCEVITTSAIDDARIYYRTMGQSYYQQANMSQGAGNYYLYDIPANIVQSPGIEFYIQVTSSEGATTTLPSYNPGLLPLSIPVLPNEAPEINHVESNTWLDRQTLPLTATVTDDDGIDQVKLFYRDAEAYFFYEIIMDNLYGDTYQAEIPGTQINQRFDLEYFFAAWDNQGCLNYWHSSYDPYFVDILLEMGPTKPAVVLEPEESSIIIPAHGGSFFFTMVALNPIPDFATCDVWADMIRPDGIIQEIDLVLYNIVLGPGGQEEQAFLQEVPDTAAAGDYLYRMHTGEYQTHITYYTASFPFTKLSASSGFGPYKDWSWEEVAASPPEQGDQEVLFADSTPTLSSGFPNPFNAATSLQFYLPEGGVTSLIIYNVEGQEVTRLTDGYHPAGHHRVYWDAASVSSGAYFARLITRNGILTSKLTLVK
ncbi:VWA domain-containing protein [bacterium]|nr:VWA domain-containing protein [bacterium]